MSKKNSKELVVQTVIEPGKRGKTLLQVVSGWGLSARVLFRRDVTKVNLQTGKAAMDFNMEGVRGKSQKRPARRLDRALEKNGIRAGIRKLLGR